MSSPVAYTLLSSLGWSPSKLKRALKELDNSGFVARVKFKQPGRRNQRRIYINYPLLMLGNEAVRRLQRAGDQETRILAEVNWKAESERCRANFRRQARFLRGANDGSCPL